MTGPPNPRTPTPPGVWPCCELHPFRYLDWRHNGHGWRCADCYAADAHTWQPWALTGTGAQARAVQPLTPTDRTRRRKPATSNRFQEAS